MKQTKKIQNCGLNNYKKLCHGLIRYSVFRIEFQDITKPIRGLNNLEKLNWENVSPPLTKTVKSKLTSNSALTTAKLSNASDAVLQTFLHEIGQEKNKYLELTLQHVKIASGMISNNRQTTPGLCNDNSPFVSYRSFRRTKQYGPDINVQF